MKLNYQTAEILHTLMEIFEQYSEVSEEVDLEDIKLYVSDLLDNIQKLAKNPTDKPVTTLEDLLESY